MDTSSQSRKLSEIEYNILKKLLENNFSGRDAILKQLLLCNVTEHLDGSGTIFFKVDPSMPYAKVNQRVPVEGRIRTNDNITDILLHVLNGKISELEFVRYKDDGRNLLLNPEDIVVKIK